MVNLVSWLHYNQYADNFHIYISRLDLFPEFMTDIFNWLDTSTECLKSCSKLTHSKQSTWQHFLHKPAPLVFHISVSNASHLVTLVEEISELFLCFYFSPSRHQLYQQIGNFIFNICQKFTTSHPHPFCFITDQDILTFYLV